MLIGQSSHDILVRAAAVQKRQQIGMNFSMEQGVHSLRDQEYLALVQRVEAEMRRQRRFFNKTGIGVSLVRYSQRGRHWVVSESSAQRPDVGNSSGRSSADSGVQRVEIVLTASSRKGHFCSWGCCFDGPALRCNQPQAVAQVPP